MFGILCFGDSITCGRGEVPGLGWVGRLQTYFESQDAYNVVYNLGVPGHTSSDLLKRFTIEADARIYNQHEGSKFIIAIAIGTNDAKWDGLPSDNKPKTTFEDFEKNIQEIISQATSYGVPVICIGLPPVDETKVLPYEDTSFENSRIEQFDSVVKRQAANHNALFLDMNKALKSQHYQAMMDDGLHPNSQGYDFMFAAIRDFLLVNKLI